MSGGYAGAWSSPLGTTLQGSGPVTLTSAAVAGNYGLYGQLILALAAATKSVSIQLSQFTGAPGGSIRVFGKLAQGPGGTEVDLPNVPHIQTTWNNLSTGNNPNPIVTFSGLGLLAGVRLAMAITNFDGATVITCCAVLVGVE